MHTEYSDYLDFDCEDNHRPRRQRKKEKQTKGRKKNSASSITINGTNVQIWSADAVNDRELIIQVRKVTRYPGIFPHMAIMPDYNLGGLSINGTILASENMIYINSVGGDIGCGISSLRLPLRIEDIEEHKDEIFHEMYAQIPTGRRINVVFEQRIDSHEIFEYESPVLNNTNKKRAKQQLGTVGDGNHFVELQADANGTIYLMVHSGSRMLGQVVRQAHAASSIDPQSSGAIEAGTKEAEAYLRDADFATRYAQENRRELMLRAIAVINMKVDPSKMIEPQAVIDNMLDAPHNFISTETHFGRELYVHRKGAVHVPRGNPGIIAGNMGDISYIVMGKGNEESFDSCSHGAGRAKTRASALNSIRLSDYLKSVEGVVCRTDQSVLDEAPEAYRDIRKVMSYQKDLVSRLVMLYPVINIKG
ncbi:RtcB family protein [Candidatus Woesearchaeota archaeon]|nr:RtcB family protein [Candidatus Woesearchaeota archaeon]